ncbi:MAG: hypothetical protein DCC67_16870 [Planctomycetota bacterium]|nr:MAG: hypothetical protein DCC67_16870 [Planctomycetota bacterium]
MLALATFDIGASHGQQIRRYRPASPTVSPYLNLLRNNDIGGLPNYYSLVRPQLQQQQFNTQQQQFNRQQMALSAQQSAAIGTLSTQLQPMTSPTGKGSGFMTEGRYFLNGGARAAGAATPRRR